MSRPDNTLDCRQQKIWSLNAFRAIVQFTPADRTRHRQRRLLASGGRCEPGITVWDRLPEARKKSLPIMSYHQTENRNRTGPRRVLHYRTGDRTRYEAIFLFASGSPSHKCRRTLPPWATTWRRKFFYCTGHTVMHRKVTSGGCISEVIRIVYHAGSDWPIARLTAASSVRSENSTHCINRTAGKRDEFDASDADTTYVHESEASIPSTITLHGFQSSFNWYSFPELPEVGFT